MKYFLIAAFGTLALAGCKVPGQKADVNADANAFCRTNYRTADVCAMDDRCQWLKKPDGSEVCKSK